MEQKYGQVLKCLLSNHKVEDLDRELSIALYHLKKSRNPKTDLCLLIDGIEKNIPVSYIIDYTLVLGNQILINQHVLCPGPETVILLEKVIEYVNFAKSSMILDLCTGSGAIAVSIAKKCNICVVATDISEEALEVAKLNATNNNVQIEFLLGDLFAPVKKRKFDVIVTNPPYVKIGNISRLPRFIRDFAPIKAINGGENGLFFHRSILSQAKKYLFGKKPVFIECEDRQEKDIKVLCYQYGWQIEEEYRNRYGNIRGFKLT